MRLYAHIFSNTLTTLAYTDFSSDSDFAFSSVSRGRHKHISLSLQISISFTITKLVWTEKYLRVPVGFRVRGGGGLHNNVLCGDASSEVQILCPFIYHFQPKSCSFHIPISKTLNPFSTLIHDVMRKKDTGSVLL